MSTEDGERPRRVPVVPARVDARLMHMRCVEFVRLIALQYGQEWSAAEADNVLWEYTGFPAFWPEPELTPARNLERQVRRYIEEGPMELTTYGRPIVDVVTSL